ncbi:MAG TPA: hypothetical protein VI461_07870, partial [Chitinophagaceae bacterium]|nr:hypothetical protein [Chitinophagaceae bacterium]
MKGNDPKPLWIVRRHDYDVDVFNILDELRSKIQSSRDKVRIKKLEEFDFIKEDEDVFVNFMGSVGVDLTEQRKYRNYILPSDYNNYFWYLGWKLIVVD